MCHLPFIKEIFFLVGSEPPPSPSTTQVLFAFGWEIFHSICSASVSFLLLHTAPRNKVHIIVTVCVWVCVRVCVRVCCVCACMYTDACTRTNEFARAYVHMRMHGVVLHSVVLCCNVLCCVAVCICCRPDLA